MDILIDTNFAITCIKQKIDFFNIAEEIIEESINWIIPSTVLLELKEISRRKIDSIDDRGSASLFIDMINEKINEGLVKVKNFENQNVDDEIVSYCITHPKLVLATLDKALKKRIKNRILSTKGKKFLKLI